MAQREGSLYLYLSIVAFLLFVGAVILFVVQRAELVDLRKDYDRLVADVPENQRNITLRQVMDQRDRYAKQISDLQIMIGGSTAPNAWPGDQTYMDRLREAQLQFNEVITAIAQPGLSPVDYQALSEPYPDMIKVLKALKGIWDEANTKSQTAYDNYRKLQETTQAQLQDCDKRNADLKQQLAAVERRLEDSEQSGRQRAEQLTGQIAECEDRYTQMELRNRNREAVLENQVSTLQIRLEKFADAMRRETTIEDLPPDGRILNVENTSQIVWMDRGRNDHMRPGLTFRVFQYVGGKKHFKGSVEVRRVEEKYSEARIVEVLDTLTPMTANDYFTSPFYDPRKPPVFVLAGTKFESPRLTTDYVNKKIAEFGAQVRSDVDIQTDFVVALKDYQENTTAKEQYRAARELGVAVIRESDLLEYLGI